MAPCHQSCLAGHTQNSYLMVYLFFSILILILILIKVRDAAAKDRVTLLEVRVAAARDQVTPARAAGGAVPRRGRPTATDVPRTYGPAWDATPQELPRM